MILKLWSGPQLMIKVILTQFCTWKKTMMTSDQQVEMIK